MGRKRVIAGRNGRADLTCREWEILGLMCDGLSGPRIAERLYISPVTVRRHSAEVVRKLGVRDRGEAIALSPRALLERTVCYPVISGSLTTRRSTYVALLLMFAATASVRAHPRRRPVRRLVDRAARQQAATTAAGLGF